MSLNAVGWDEAPPPLLCHISTATTSIPTGVDSPISLAAAGPRIDTGHFWDISSPNLLTIPRDGFYWCSGLANWAGNATGIRTVEIRVTWTSGTPGSLIQLIQESAVNIVASSTQQVTSGLLVRPASAGDQRLLAGDTVELLGFQNSGGNLNAQGTALQIFYLGNALSYI